MKISEIQVSYYPNILNKIKITSSKILEEVLRGNWNPGSISLFEEFKAILLNNSNQTIGIVKLGEGNNKSTVIDFKRLFQVVLKTNAANIILAHNHPSGSLKPSQADIEITTKVKKGCDLLDVKLLDHVILTSESYYSFADNSII